MCEIVEIGQNVGFPCNCYTSVPVEHVLTGLFFLKMKHVHIWMGV